MTNTLVEIKNLSRNFGAFTAVDNISFSVKKGEVMGFLGPNGAGKSTTMRMITGYLAPSNGTATIAGHNIATAAVSAKQSMGYLPEGGPLYQDMTPYNFLAFIGSMRGLRGSTLRQRLDYVTEALHLSAVLHQPIETLSKGFKRRVALAQSILHDPAVLILDEPTDGLDPNQKHEVRLLIQAMAKDKAIIISTHILEEVEAVCSRAVVISAGRIVAEGTPKELAAHSKTHNLEEAFRQITAPKPKKGA